MGRAKVLDENPCGLTFRECEILEQLIRLGSPKAVAHAEAMSTKTVRNVIRGAVQRMKVKTPLQAAVEFDRRRRMGVEFRGQRPRRSVFDVGAAP